MARLLGILILILSILLFPPAALAVVSNNAVPGDKTYPIKRELENIIFAVASLHPTSKTWFAAARSDRRFAEVKLLVTKGRSAGVTLRELVVQADTAVEEIVKIENPSKKRQLLDQFQQNINEYKQGLTEIREQVPQAAEPTQDSVATPHPTPTPSPARREQPTSTPRPTATPESTTTPTATPQPTQSPVPQPSTSITPPEDIDNAIEGLEDINDKINEEKENAEIQQQQQPSPTPQSETKFKLFSATNTGTNSTTPQFIPEDPPTLTPSPEPTFAPCLSPSSPTVLKYDANTKTVSWNESSNAFIYHVRLVTPSGEQHNFDNIPRTWYTFAEDVISLPGNYSWWVDAVNDCGVSRTGSTFQVN